MPSHPDSPIAGLVPPERLAAVQRFLDTALGGAKIWSADRLAGGASGASLVRVETAEAAYVLRFDSAPDGFREPARQYACQAIAAAAGAAPALVHADPAERLSLSTFVAAAEYGTDRAARLAQLATALRRLHATPLFPRLMPYLDAMDILLAGFAASGVLPSVALERPMALYSRLAVAYRPGQETPVSSHNDLNPSNVLFTAEGAVIVDWESAFAADRYVDIAAMLNFFTAGPEEEALALAAYFGRAPSAAEAARAAAMRQVNRLFYAAMLLGAAKRAMPGLSVSEEELATARLADLRGQMALMATPEGQARFGCAFLNAATEALEGPGFEATLARL